MKIIVSIWLAVCCSISWAQDGHKELEEIISAYDNDGDLAENAEYFRTLFDACDENDLAALQTQKNDSIATQSAWEAVEMTVPVEEGPKVFRPDSKKLTWFVGFFEGRNRVLAPNWWKEVVADARANHRYNIYPGDPKLSPYHHSAIESVTCPTDAMIEEKNGVVTYRQGANSIVLPEEVLARNDGLLWCNISCCFTDTNCFVAVHDNFGYSHDVASIDRATKKLVWKSEACGCWTGGASGGSESWVSMIATKDGQLFVFGSTSIGMYAHGFDSATGKTLLRFSNYH